MAGYTALKLTEVENQGEKFGFDPEVLQFRMAKDPLNCESCGISYERLGPNFRMPFGHKHKVQEEVFVLITGSARMKVEDDEIDLEPWSAVRVSPDTMRSLEAGPDGAEFVVVGAPKTGPGDADIVQGWWTE